MSTSGKIRREYELSITVDGEKKFALYSDGNVFFAHDSDCMPALRSTAFDAQEFLQRVPDKPIEGCIPSTE